MINENYRLGMKNIFLLLIATLLIASCAEESVKEPAKVQMTFVMRARAESANGRPADPVDTLAVERFNHYWVVFTDGTSDNRIVAVVKKDCQLTEKDEFTVKLSPGTYKTYAFANIADSYLEGLGIALGNKMPDLSGTLFTPDTRFWGNDVTTLLPAETFQADYKEGRNPGIPMTSVNGHTVTITNAVTVNTSIEVVRMFAKLEFVITNNIDSVLTIHSLSVSNLTVNDVEDGKDFGFIPLCNDDSRSLTYLQGKPFKTLTHSFGTGLTLPAKTEDEPAPEPLVKAFYVLESMADTITNSFMLNFNLGAGNERFALTDPNTLTAIRRNDWIRIPVSFNDWLIRLEARNYPPIGGYPETEIDSLKSNEFTVIFDGGGEFVIRPYIRKFTEGNTWFGIDNTAKILGAPTITIDDPDDLFLKLPQLNDRGEIRGTMDVAKGVKACITLTVNVITDPTASPVLTKALTRKIYVTQK